jgi:DNA-binding response OmpR family regulator
VLHRGRELKLDPREFELAFMLFRNPDHLLTRDFLWIALWKQLPRKGARALDIAAAGVRKKLDLREENGVLLRAAYKRGYELLTVTPQAVAPRLALSSS